MDLYRGAFQIDRRTIIPADTLVHREDSIHGSVEITASRPADAEGVSGGGIVTTLTFEAKTSGRFAVKITRAAVVQPDRQVTPVSATATTVSIE